MRVAGKKQQAVDLAITFQFLFQGKKPALARVVKYNPDAWPLLRRNRSRSGSLGFLGSYFMIPPKNRSVTISVAERLPPGWPDPARWMDSQAGSPDFSGNFFQFADFVSGCGRALHKKFQ